MQHQQVTITQITKSVHCQSGHPGVKWTLYFVRQIDPSVSKAAVRECKECQSIDPAPVQWPKGQLNVSKVWHHVEMDITHHNGTHYLTLIDRGPTWFTIWRHLCRQDSISAIDHLRALLFECGPQTEFLTDNDTAWTI